jgi:hypothetical protein
MHPGPQDEEAVEAFPEMNFDPSGTVYHKSPGTTADVYTIRSRAVRQEKSGDYAAVARMVDHVTRAVKRRFHSWVPYDTRLLSLDGRAVSASVHELR